MLGQKRQYTDIPNFFQDFRDIVYTMRAMGIDQYQAWSIAEIARYYHILRGTYPLRIRYHDVLMCMRRLIREDPQLYDFFVPHPQCAQRMKRVEEVGIDTHRARRRHNHW